MDKELKETLTEMDDKLDLILQWKAGFEERCVAHRDKTEELRCTLYGEKGNNGMVKQVDRLVQSKGQFNKWQDFWLCILKVVIATSIISLAGWLFFMYKSI